MQQGHELPISENDRGISPFREDLFSRNFAYSKFRENNTLAKISEFTVFNCIDLDNSLINER